MISPPVALFRLQLRRLRRTTIVWPALVATVIATSIASYRGLYTTAEDRADLVRTLGNDPTLGTLFGTPHALDTAQGFASWRSLGSVAILAAVWGIALGTRIFRGDEERGRSEVAFTGSLSRRSATAATLCACLVPAFGFGVLATAITFVLRGDDYSASSTAVFGLAMAIVPTFFVLVGALAAQLLSTRRAAAAAGAAVFILLFVVRIVADQLEAGWLRWLTPYGWVENAEVFAGSRWTVFPLWLGACALLFGAVVLLSSKRDYGSGLLRHERAAVSRLGGLGSTAGLAVRLRTASVVGWLLATTSVSLLLGVLVQSVVNVASGSLQTEQVFARWGIGDVGLYRYSGVYMLMLVLLLCCAAVGFAASGRDEESEGRLDVLLAEPVVRTRWFVERIVLHGIVLVSLAMIAGAGVWSGIALRGTTTDFGRFFEAGLNLVPLTLLVFAASTLLHAVAPRWTAPGGYAILGWSFLVQTVGLVSDSMEWIYRLSIFHYMRLAPSQQIDAGTNAAVLLIAIVLLMAATWSFRRRDLVNE